MNISRLVGALSLVAVATGCTGAASRAAVDAPEQSCSYDSPEELLVAMKQAFGDEATARMATAMSGPGLDMRMEAALTMSIDGFALDAKYLGDDEFRVIAVDDQVFFSDAVENPSYVELPADDPDVRGLLEQGNLLHTPSMHSMRLSATSNPPGGPNSPVRRSATTS